MGENRIVAFRLTDEDFGLLEKVSGKKSPTLVARQLLMESVRSEAAGNGSLREIRKELVRLSRFVIEVDNSVLEVRRDVAASFGIVLLQIGMPEERVLELVSKHFLRESPAVREVDK